MTEVIDQLPFSETAPVEIKGIFSIDVVPYGIPSAAYDLSAIHGLVDPQQMCIGALTNPATRLIYGSSVKGRSKLRKASKLGIREIAAAAFLSASRVEASGELPSQPVEEIAFPGPVNRIANHEAEQWHSLKEKMEAFSELTEGWNGYSAPAPSKRSIENAVSFFKVLRYYDFMPSRVVPSAVGGVAITRRIGAKKVCVEFFNNGLISALFADDETETMHTMQFKNSLDAYDDAVSEIEDYLNG